MAIVLKLFYNQDVKGLKKAYAFMNNDSNIRQEKLMNS